MSLVAIAKCLYCDKNYYADTTMLGPPIVECNCAQEAIARVQRLEVEAAKNREEEIEE